MKTLASLIFTGWTGYQFVMTFSYEMLGLAIIGLAVFLALTMRRK